MKQALSPKGFKNWINIMISFICSKKDKTRVRFKKHRFLLLYRFLYLSFDILVLCIISTLTQMGLSPNNLASLQPPSTFLKIRFGLVLDIYVASLNCILSPCFETYAANYYAIHDQYTSEFCTYLYFIILCLLFLGYKHSYFTFTLIFQFGSKIVF